MTLELDRHGWVQIPILPLPSKAGRHLKRRELVEETKAGGERGEVAAEVEVKAGLQTKPPGVAPPQPQTADSDCLGSNLALPLASRVISNKLSVLLHVKLHLPRESWRSK